MSERSPFYSLIDVLNRRYSNPSSLLIRIADAIAYSVSIRTQRTKIETANNYGIHAPMPGVSTFLRLARAESFNDLRRFLNFETKFRVEESYYSP